MPCQIAKPRPRTSRSSGHQSSSQPAGLRKPGSPSSACRAGYTSTVEDLGKFASWQFRLLRSGQTNVLKAPTLREMQRVQFMDPDWKTSWGLGFRIEHSDDHIYVGHRGYCPGYHSVLSMRTDDQTAVIVIDNSSEITELLARVVFAILDKREGDAFKQPLPVAGVKLEEYAGPLLPAAMGLGIGDTALGRGAGLSRLANGRCSRRHGVSQAQRQ
jgi:CubicO group peptidase (beta-lactamase class C family)